MDLTKTSAVIMLTDNDLTVDDADRFFLEGKDVPFPYWGFNKGGGKRIVSGIHYLHEGRVRFFGGVFSKGRSSVRVGNII